LAATAILDTDVFSDVARGAPSVSSRFGEWLAEGNGVVISRVTAYEFRRGVYAGSLTDTDATAGELFLSLFSVIDPDEDTWNLAAEIWGALARVGKTRRLDADILIAATALRGEYEVVTRNRDDFERIRNVRPSLVCHYW
jgi:predicted nucleic acid-binding protein